MTPEERCYKILQESKYIRIPEEDPAQKIEYFLKTADQCSWENPSDKIQERQFETSFKNWFSQFEKEMMYLAKNNPPTIEGKSGPFDDIGFHTMDDQGFEGEIMGDGSYLRNIESSLEYKFCGVSDSELESRWQTQTNLIASLLHKAFDDSATTEEANKFGLEAREAQNKQESIQAEITRRAK